MSLSANPREMSSSMAPAWRFSRSSANRTSRRLNLSATGQGQELDHTNSTSSLAHFTVTIIETIRKQENNGKMKIHIHLHLHVHIHIHLHLHIHLHIHLQLHMHACAYTYMCVVYAHPTCALSPGKRCQEHMGRAGLKSCQPHSILFTPPTSRAVTLSSGGAFETTKRRWPPDRLQR